MRIKTLLFLCCASVACWAMPAGNENARSEYNILDFGASRDTSQVVTQAINAAIEQCHAQGGGRVLIPAGKYVSGTIFMKDNVELHLAHGATIYASRNPQDFPVQPHATYRSDKDAAGWASLIYAVEADNIAITGHGTIDGLGKGRRNRVNGVDSPTGRPSNIRFISCRNVSVKGVEILNSGGWNQHYLNCEDVLVDGIRVYNHCNSNNDGIDIDGCRRFVLANSVIDADDDAIVLKSTGTAPCEDVTVTGCVASSFANAIKCGTESTGGFRNIAITGCVVKPSTNTGHRVLKSTTSGITAISLEIVDGGVMEGMVVSDIVIEGTECPLFVRLGNRARKHHPDAPNPPMGQMRHIIISDITAYGTGNFASSITGVPGGRIEDVYLSNLRFFNRGGLKEGNYRTPGDMGDKRHDMGANLWLERYWPTHTQLVEDEKGYPQPTVWANLPCYGLFIRHAESVTIDGATFRTEGEEPRIPIIAVDMDYLEINGLQVNKPQSTAVLLDQVKTNCINPAIKVKKHK